MAKQFKFGPDAWKYNNTRLTNQIFKLLPMYENEEDWQSQRHTVVDELHGYNKMFEDNPHFMVLIAKLMALDCAEDKMIFRKRIFEAISELKSIQI